MFVAGLIISVLQGLDINKGSWAAAAGERQGYDPWAGPESALREHGLTASSKRPRDAEPGLEGALGR